MYLPCYLSPAVHFSRDQVVVGWQFLRLLLPHIGSSSEWVSFQKRMLTYADDVAAADLCWMDLQYTFGQQKNSQFLDSFHIWKFIFQTKKQVGDMTESLRFFSANWEVGSICFIFHIFAQNVKKFIFVNFFQNCQKSAFSWKVTSKSA